jgi:hypothetical protein
MTIALIDNSVLSEYRTGNHLLIEAQKIDRTIIYQVI